MNEKDLKKHLYRHTLKKYDDIPIGSYEVWHYWYMFNHSIGFGRRDNWIAAMIIFNDEGIVYKKFFSDVSQATLTFQNFEVINQQYVELY
jgi:hypothetical protein